MLVKPTRGAVLDKSHPLARGIVGCWLFNEATGEKVCDLSGYSNDGTLNGDTHFVPGKFGSALDFDGDGDYIDINVGTVPEPWTALAWIKRRSDNLTKTLIGDSPAGKWVIVLEQYPDTHKVGITHAGFADYASTYGTPLNAWAQVVLIGADSKVYVYGDAILEDTLSTGSTSLAANYIGRRTADSNSPDALIDHLIIWGRGLSASEIAWLYREPFAMISIPSPPLVVISGTSSASSTATVDWVVEASVSGTSSVTPDATVEWSAAVDVDAASTVTPDAVVDWGAAVGVDASSTVTPDAVVDWGAVVDIDATSAVSPDAVVEWGAATQVDGESGLTVGAVVDWAAETTIGATSSVTPGATVDWSAATQIDATSGLTGTASIGEVFVEGTIGATSSVTVGAIVDWAAETSIAAAATVAADLTGLFLLEVSIAAASSLTGTAQTGLLHSASGTISAVASIIGTLRNTRDANWTVDTSTTSITWQNVSEDNDITWTLE